MGFKFLYPLTGLALGIFLSSKFFEGLSFGMICIGAALVFWIVITRLSKDPLKSVTFSKFHWVWIIFLFSGIGALNYEWRSKPVVSNEINNEPVTVTATIEEVNYIADGDRFKVKINSVADSLSQISTRNLHMLIKTDGYVAQTGDIVSFKVKPRLISQEEKRNDFAKRMKNKGILYYANVKAADIEKTGESHSLSFFASEIRNHLAVLLEKSSLERGTSEFIISILLGDKTLLSNDVKQTLNSAGLAHILALSGMHVAIIFSIVLVLLFPLSLYGHHKARKIIAIFLLWVYVVLSGGAPSTVRAAIMASFVVLAYVLERKNSALNSLFAAVLIILIANPLSLWDVGLQLSFLCVAAILIFTDKLNPVEHHIHPNLFKFCDILLISLITTFCTWTIVGYYFTSVPIIFLPANFVLLPVFPFFLGGSILFLALLLIGYDFNLLAKGLDLFHDLFVGSADWLSLGGISTIKINIPLASTVFWLAAMLLIAIALYSKVVKKRRMATIGAIFTGLISISLILYNPDVSSSSIKFYHSFTKMEASLLEDGKKTDLSYPRNNIASTDYGKIKILSVDCKIHPDSLESLKERNKGNQTSNYLIIGSNAENSQIAELINGSDFRKVILHSGFGKNKKEELLTLLDNIHWDKIYSLRDLGSLEIEI